MDQHLLTFTARENRENYLHLAVRKRRKKTVEYLVEKVGLDVNSKMQDGAHAASVFAIACQYGEDVETVKYLFEHGAAQNCLDEMNASIRKVSTAVRKMEQDEVIPASKEDRDEGTEYFIKPKYFPVLHLEDFEKMEDQNNNKNKMKMMNPISAEEEQSNNNKIGRAHV